MTPELLALAPSALEAYSPPPRGTGAQIGR